MCHGDGCSDHVMRPNYCEVLRSLPGAVNTVVNVGYCLRDLLTTTQRDDVTVVYFKSQGGLSWFLCPRSHEAKIKVLAGLGSDTESPRRICFQSVQVVGGT